MSKITIENARIKSTTLGEAATDRGMFSYWLHIEWERSGCSFGGKVLDERQFPGQECKDYTRIGTAYGMTHLMRILETLEVRKWEDLPGTYLRIKSEGLGGGITAIGHIIKDQWFDPNALKFLLKEKGDG